MPAVWKNSAPSSAYRIIRSIGEGPERRSHRVLGFSSLSSSRSSTVLDIARATIPMSSRMLGTVSLPSLANASFALLAIFSRKLALFRLPVSGGIRSVPRHISTTTFVEVLQRSSILTSSRRWNRIPSFRFSYGRLLTGDVHHPLIGRITSEARPGDLNDSTAYG